MVFGRKKVRIVALADTHTFEADLAPLPRGDVLVHAGDIGRAGTAEELRPSLQWLLAQPFEHIIVVPGNHDRLFEDDPAQARALVAEIAAERRHRSVHVLIDQGVVLAGLQWWGSPWQPAYNDWAFNLPRGESLAARWALIPASTDVLVTHGPPYGYGDDVLAGLDAAKAADTWTQGVRDQRQGCRALTKALDRVQPALHLFGHIHANGGAWQHGTSTLVNATSWECERAPSVLDVYVKRKEVVQVAIPPRTTL